MLHYTAPLLHKPFSADLNRYRDVLVRKQKLRKPKQLAMSSCSCLLHWQTHLHKV